MRIPQLPNLPDLPSVPDPFGSLKDKLNPFNDLKDMLFSGWKWLNEVGLQFLIDPIGPQGSPWVNGILSSAWGWATLISVLATIFTLVLAGANAKYLKNATSSAIALVLIATVGGLWFWLNPECVKAGNFLAHEISRNMSGKSSIPANPIGSLFGSIVGYPAVIFPMGLMVMISIMYMVVNIVFQALGIVAFSLRFVGDKLAVVSDFLIAGMLVTTIIGRPVAALSVGIGNQMGSGIANWLPSAVADGGKSQTVADGVGTFLAFACTAAGWWWAILWQAILLVFCFVGVAKVTGNIKTVGEWVTGKVETSPQKSDVNVTSFNSDYHLSNSAPPVVVADDSSRRSQIVRAVKEEAGHQLIAAAAITAAAAASGGSSVAAKATVTAATRAAQRHTPRGIDKPK